MIAPSIRLRRAILLNDVLLVHRIIRNNFQLLQNPDFADSSNTSLHLAALHGLPEICMLLISLGHDATEISRNTDHNTPLMLAAKHGNYEVGTILAKQFTRCIPYQNKYGLDALALAAQCPNSTSLIPILLQDETFPASVAVQDLDGNTPLHHASASGSLKALRILLAAGANPLAKNNYDWTPLAYSQTVAAEVYFKNLIQEVEKRRVEYTRASEEAMRKKMAAAAGGLRMVSRQEQEDEDEGQEGEGRVEEEDEQVVGDALKRHWSPGERRQPGTPNAALRHEWGSPPLLEHIRTRSGDGRTGAESG